MRIPPRQFLLQTDAALGAASLPLISVVLPVYNQASLLRESVCSVLTQHGVNLELIVVNDGSTDDVHGALGQYVDDPRLRVINQENQGLSAALNRGFDDARGEFFTWTSADNRYLTGALKTLCHFLASHPEIGMAFGNVQLIDDVGVPIPNSSYRQHEQSPEDSSVLLLPIEGGLLTELPDNFVNACFMYRRAVARNIGGYNQFLLGIEDYDYWLRISQIAPIVHVDSELPLYQYRLHGNSLTAHIPPDTLTAQTESLVQGFHEEVLKKFGDETQPALPLLTIESLPSLLLRRARSSNFQAVKAERKGQWINLVAFQAPGRDSDVNATCLAKLIERAPDDLFVLLACDAPSRTVADSTNRLLRNNQNLRIIDISSEICSSRQGDRVFPDPALRALLFVLSSVSGVLYWESCASPELDTQNLFRWAVAAAQAGRPLGALCSEHQLKACGEISSTLTDAPHTYFSDYRLHHDVFSEYSTLKRNLSIEPDQKLLDSWLKRSGICTLFCGI